MVATRANDKPALSETMGAGPYAPKGKKTSAAPARHMAAKTVKKVPVKRSRSDRLEVRTTDEQNALIREAAALRGWTVTQFVLDTVVERAEQVLREQRTLTLPNKVFDTFMAALDGPAEAVPELVDLFNRPSPIPPG
jgi:uncharacterized protein (DUF1778 family)